VKNGRLVAAHVNTDFLISDETASTREAKLEPRP
jgi:hypothetical protein